MSGQDRTLRRFGRAVPRGSWTLTNTRVLALALCAAACTVGEPAARPPEPAPPVAQAPGEVALPAPPEPGARPAAPRERAPAIIGVILPRSGPGYLQQYADLLLEGIRLAATDAHGDVELVVLDDGGLAERDSALIEEAADQGAVAVIGPMLSSGVERASTASAGLALPLISPTAADVPQGARHVYTLNAVDVRGARALAEYAMRGSLTSAAVLYPSETERSRQAWAFSRAYQELGGRIATMVPYDSGTTTFGTHIGRVLDSRPQVVYLPLSPQDVQLIAPQLAYYGLRAGSIVMLGNESWTDDEVLRLVSPRFTNDVIASAPSPRIGGETSWDEFVRRYEETYRRSLDNPFPALGYDAMTLVLYALERGADSPAGVADALAGVRAFRGATGILSVEDGAITRAPFLFRLHEGTLTAAPPPEQLLWPPADSSTGGSRTEPPLQPAQ